jgi:hypothetical protein
MKDCRDSTNWGDDRGLNLVSHFAFSVFFCRIMESVV